MKIIALETSTQPGSIAASNDGQVVFEFKLPESEKTAETFAAQLKRMLGELDWTAQEIDAIAVCEGPGSFTGLRIGITAAKVFAYATRAKIVAPPTTLVLAEQAQLQSVGQRVWTAIDAQRGDVFAALYQLGKEGLEQIEPIGICERSAWMRKFQTGDFVIGDALRRINLDQLNDDANLNSVQICDSLSWEPSAASLIRCAEGCIRAGMFADTWKLVPKYYRKSAAEEKLTPQS